MTAYTVIDIDIVDDKQMRIYETGMAELLPRFGAELLARETDAVVLDGSWAPRLFVLLAFPDKASILRFYDSEAYAPLKAIRQTAARSNVLAIDGFEFGLAS